MNKLLLALAAGSVALMSLSAHAYYEDNNKVMELADGGVPQIAYSSEDCPKSYGNKAFTHKLGAGTGYSSLCVKQVKIPADVLSEIRTMKENELENESDYDQRLTKLYVFEQDNYQTNLSESGVRELAKALGIPSDQIKNISFNAFVPDASSFGQFEGLVIGEDFVDESQSLKYLRQLLKGQLVLGVSFGDEIELYPGGGFGVTYYLYFTKGKVVYVKQSGWDA